MIKQEHFICASVLADFPTCWCVVEYMVADPAGIAPPTIMLITACKLRDVFTFGEANRNSEWRKCVSPQHTVIATVHATGTRTECQREANRMIMNRNPRPRCNVYGHNSFAIGSKLLCSDGKEYESQLEASRILGINQGALSRHLKGELKHVRGYTFSYKD